MWAVYPVIPYQMVPCVHPPHFLMGGAAQGGFVHFTCPQEEEGLLKWSSDRMRDSSRPPASKQCARLHNATPVAARAALKSRQQWRDLNQGQDQDRAAVGGSSSSSKADSNPETPGTPEQTSLEAPAAGSTSLWASSYHAQQLTCHSLVQPFLLDENFTEASLPPAAAANHSATASTCETTHKPGQPALPASFLSTTSSATHQAQQLNHSSSGGGVDLDATQDAEATCCALWPHRGSCSSVDKKYKKWWCCRKVERPCCCHGRAGLISAEPCWVCNPTWAPIRYQGPPDKEGFDRWNKFRVADGLPPSAKRFGRCFVPVPTQSMGKWQKTLPHHNHSHHRQHQQEAEAAAPQSGEVQRSSSPQVATLQPKDSTLSSSPTAAAASPGTPSSALRSLNPHAASYKSAASTWAMISGSSPASSSGSSSSTASRPGASSCLSSHACTPDQPSQSPRQLQGRLLDFSLLDLSLELEPECEETAVAGAGCNMASLTEASAPGDDHLGSALEAEAAEGSSPTKEAITPCQIGDAATGTSLFDPGFVLQLPAGFIECDI